MQQVLRYRNFSIFKGPREALSWKRLGETLNIKIFAKKFFWLLFTTVGMYKKLSKIIRRKSENPGQSKEYYKITRETSSSLVSLPQAKNFENFAHFRVLRSNLGKLFQNFWGGEGGQNIPWPLHSNFGEGGMHDAPPPPCSATPALLSNFSNSQGSPTKELNSSRKHPTTPSSASI